LLGGISKDNPEDRGLSERCLVGFNTGPPMLPSKYNNNMQLLQFSDHVVVVTEMIHDAHIIPLDGRPDLNPAITQWPGIPEGIGKAIRWCMNLPSTIRQHLWSR
jgi:hypothetical protein